MTKLLTYYDFSVRLLIISDAKHHVMLLQMKFQINFDYNFDQLQNQAEVKFEAKRYARLIIEIKLKSKTLNYIVDIY